MLLLAVILALGPYTNPSQLTYTATSGTSRITLSPGLPYVPGVPVVAVLYDVTSAVNTALDTGTLDTSGWTTLSWLHRNSGGVATFDTYGVDDTGAVYININSGLTGLAAGGLGPGTTIGTVAGTSVQYPLTRRWRATATAIAAQTTRLRIEVRR